ncbi:hypothetical protein [Alkalihalobacterium bogoriense]|uniref:hypothetical protein n=1 Tax=Alkalihalobacterium bogoriense TaxID=246272 RepID=UPI00047987CA|nr:hypothetical protein [Alkalihalobacterium bogoriense]
MEFENIEAKSSLSGKKGAWVIKLLFLKDKKGNFWSSSEALKAYSRRAKAAHLRVSPQEEHLWFTVKSGQGSALRLKRKDAPRFSYNSLID